MNRIDDENLEWHKVVVAIVLRWCFQVDKNKKIVVLDAKLLLILQLMAVCLRLCSSNTVGDAEEFGWCVNDNGTTSYSTFKRKKE